MAILCCVGFIAPYSYHKGKEEVEKAFAERRQGITQKAQETRQATIAKSNSDDSYARKYSEPKIKGSLSTSTRSTATKLTVPLNDSNLSFEVPKSTGSPAKRRLNPNSGGKRRTRKYKKHVTKRQQLRKIRQTGKKGHRNSKKFRMKK